MEVRGLQLGRCLDMELPLAQKRPQSVHLREQRTDNWLQCSTLTPPPLCWQMVPNQKLKSTSMKCFNGGFCSPDICVPIDHWLLLKEAEHTLWLQMTSPAGCFGFMCSGIICCQTLHSVMFSSSAPHPPSSLISELQTSKTIFF